VATGEVNSPPEPPERLPEVGEKAKSMLSGLVTLVEKGIVYAPGVSPVTVRVEPLAVAVTGELLELRE